MNTWNAYMIYPFSENGGQKLRWYQEEWEKSATTKL